MSNEVLKTRCEGCGREKDGVGKYCLTCYSIHNIRCQECNRENIEQRANGAVIVCRRRKRKCERCKGTGFIEV